MFTTGSKLFLGATTLTLLTAIVLGLSKGGDIGWTATIGLTGAAIAFGLLTGINFYVRDSNVSGMDADATTTSSAAQDPVGSSMWPIVTALGLGLLVVGLVTEPIVFKAGVVVLLAVTVEWMVLTWSERASGDRAYNAALRKRVLNPLEFPVLGAIGLTVIIYSFSRIMLFLSKSGGPVVFGVLATVLLIGGVVFASKPTIKTSVVIGVCTIAALGLVSVGAVTAIDGQRDIEAHEIIANDPEICESTVATEADHNTSQGLGAKSNITAIVTLLADGTLSAHASGIDGNTDTLTIPRSTPSYVLFRNQSNQDARLTAHLGAFTEDVNGTAVTTRPLTCTGLIEANGAQFLTLNFAKTSAGTLESDPYALTVPGLEGSSITIVVP